MAGKHVHSWFMLPFAVTLHCARVCFESTVLQVPNGVVSVFKLAGHCMCELVTFASPVTSHVRFLSAHRCTLAS
jgi:hypothetical protein